MFKVACTIVTTWLVIEWGVIISAVYFPLSPSPPLTFKICISKHTVAKQLYEEAMKQGSVKMSIIKCLVLGIAGVGKTHLKRLLLSEGIDGTTARVSTGLADNPVQAFVGSINSILAGVDEEDNRKWEVMDEAKLIQILANAYHVEPLPLAPTPPQLSHLQQSQVSNSEAIHDMPDNISHTLPTSAYISPSILVVASEGGPLPELRTDKAENLFIEALKNISETKVLNLKLVHFIDSGGQPQFLDLLPAFVQDVSAILFAVNLSESLDHTPMIYFYGKDGKPVGESYQSPSSHKQVLEQCVRAADTRDVHPEMFVAGTHQDKEPECSVHPKVFVVGTHRDKEYECPENRKVKDNVVRCIVPSMCLVENNEEAIWAINGKDPTLCDLEVANLLREAIVTRCSKGISRPLPIKWFVLEMRIRESATRGVISLQKCLLLAQRLGMDEQGLEAALLHMVKYNLFLWYHNVPGLRDVVFSNPQVILQIITDLVQCKHDLAALGSKGVIGSWRADFKNHAIVSHEFLSHDHFKRHFIDGIFLIKHFTVLMCHRYIMVHLEGDKYQMPALLDPLSSEGLHRECKLLDPLVVYFPSRCTPYGLFSCLITYLLKKCSWVENNKVPVCLYRNCISFMHKEFPAKFTIIDSVSYIEVHLDKGDCTKVCPRIRQLIHEGIKKCAEVLHYSGGKDLKDGFICSRESCKGVARLYEDDICTAGCIQCSSDMDLSNRHAVWLSTDSVQTQSKNEAIINGKSS